MLFLSEYFIWNFYTIYSFMSSQAIYFQLCATLLFIIFVLKYSIQNNYDNYYI